MYNIKPFTKLDEIYDGDIFLYENYFYMKVFNGSYVDENVSCLNLATSEIEYINKKEHINLLPDAKISLHIV